MVVLDLDGKDDCQSNSGNVFCNCETITPECLLGPDTLGSFNLVEVPVSWAENCEPSFCICTTHPDYIQISKERVEGVLTFDERRDQFIEEAN